ncbi:hypothetical protein B0A58_01435 [Flavobacterium branchiophilum NBRC 15030 = ATCC 35035]|nr:restriction endonuclease subunit S [Flavobacterium branchiophilum]OXA81259.1 hypothetical protein B0A58_01435 [Flavobacterium branchiophilum NBRC 15030 = ATCC 35035]
MDLKNIQWGEFEIGKIFNVSTGNLLPKEILKQGNIPRITATDNNNGIYGLYQKVSHKNYREFTNFISVSFLGSVFYHSYTASLDMKIHTIQIPNKELNTYLAEFLILCIKRTVSIFSYGDQLSSSDLPKKKILLPINKKGEPDYAFMEKYMRQKESAKLVNFQNYISERIEQVKNFKNVGQFENRIWKEFKLTNIFNFAKGDQNNMANIEKGQIPLVSAKKGDNGCKDFASQKNKKLFSKNSLTLNNDGDGGAGISFYQPFDYLLDSHVTALNPKTELNKHILLFISRCITAQQEKFGHGYSINNQRLKVFKLMLPIDKKGEPDYDFMENYTKKLEYEKLTNYLTRKTTNA